MTAVFLETALFLASLAVTLTAAAFFARRLDRIGLQLGLPETLLGLLTALAADAPELASAIVALVKGDHSAGVGVVVGSNVFNLAAMVGLTAVLAGHVRVRREAVVFEGVVALTVALAAAGVIASVIGPAAGIAIIAVVFVPYLAVLTLGPERVARAPLGGGATRFLRRSFGAEHRPKEPVRESDAILRPALLLVPAVAIIVAGATVMVETALRLSDRAEVPSFVTGVLVLAVLTSLPNAFTAARLGLHGRGSAVLSEALNSNTINLVAGVAIPALLLTLGDFSGLVALDLAWLLVLTAAVLALLARPQGVGRGTGAFLAASFVAFAVVQAVAS
jgi:cation:H+ antiporter